MLPQPRPTTAHRAGFPGSREPSHANTVRYHGRRRLVQATSFALAILVPASGLMRIDPGAGALVVLDRQIWFADFFLIAGLWIMLASVWCMLYSVAGTVFCGWVCPQNILSEWANFVTHRLLGRRAKVEMDGSAPIVAVTKNKALNWILLALSLLAASMLVAIVPLFYFYPPPPIWSFVTWRAGSRARRLAALHIFRLRADHPAGCGLHPPFLVPLRLCHRVWQHSFRTRETLHVSYDASRADSCTKCNYCVSSCFIEIDPRKTAVYDSCINCGECVDACNRMHQNRAKPGLLSFEFGETQAKSWPGRGSATTPPRWPPAANGCWRSACSVPVCSSGACEPGSRCTWWCTAPRCSTARAISTTASRYRTSCTMPGKVLVRVTGLAAADYTLGAAQIEPAGRGT